MSSIVIENLRAWLELLALAFSPLIAVQVSERLRKRQERRNQKLWVLWTLVSTRHSQFADDRLRAINSVEFYYHDSPSVRKLFQEYMTMLGNEGLNNTQGFAERDRKLTELVDEMARTLGYGKTFSSLDFQRGYVPKYLGQVMEQQQKQQQLNEAMLAFFTKAQGVIPNWGGKQPGQK